MSSESIQQQSRRADGGNGAQNGDTLRAMPGKLRDGVEAAVEAQKERASDSTQSAADAARKAARGLHGDEAWMAGLVERGADGLAGLAETLRSNDMNALLGRVEAFARGQPVLFTGAAFALGFALTRTARAAAAQQAETAADPPMPDTDVPEHHLEH